MRSDNEALGLTWAGKGIAVVVIRPQLSLRADPFVPVRQVRVRRTGSNPVAGVLNVLWHNGLKTDVGFGTQRSG